jgi:membrane protease YdiL (CAAX protease family)
MNQFPLELGSRHHAPRQQWLLVFVAISSLIQFKAIAMIVHPLLEWVAATTGAHFLSWMITFRLPALLWCGGWYLAVARHSSAQSPKPPVPWRKLALLALATLGITASIIVGSSVWTQPVATLEGALVLVVVAVLVEEYWFRGVVYAVLTDRFPASPRLAITVSSVLFSLNHWQYHAFHLTLPALAQIVYTLPLGFVFGYLRSATGRLWPGILLHMAINGLAAIRP